MFRQIRLADFEQPQKRSHVASPRTAQPTVFPNGNIVSTHPLNAVVLPPKPAVLADLASSAGADSAKARADIDPQTGWGMLAASDGVRLWPIRGRNAQITPIFFQSSTPLIPVFLSPGQDNSQPEVVLIGESTGEILHYKRISFTLSEKPVTASLGLAPNDRVTHAIAAGTSIVCATSSGNLYAVRFRNRLGDISKPTVSRISPSWFSAWHQSPIVDLSANGNRVACLRQSGQVTTYSVENTFTQLGELSLRSLDLRGEFMSCVLDNAETLQVVVQTSPTSYRLARIVSGILEQQHILPEVTSNSARVYTSATTKYVLFDHQLVLVESKPETIKADPNMTVQSLFKTSRNLGLEASKSASLYLKNTPFGCKPCDDGFLMITGQGVLEVKSEISPVSLSSLLDQVVFNWTPQSPVVFGPAIKAAIGSDGYVTANKAVLNLCHDISASVKVAPVPNIDAHLELRISRTRALAEFVTCSLVLNDETRVYLQNTLEQLLTTRSLADLASTISSDSRSWLLYHTDQVTLLLQKAPIERVVEALYLAINGAPTLISPETPGYWLAQPEVVHVLRNGKHTPEYVELACRVLSYSKGSGNMSLSRTQQDQNALLRGLASNGHDDQAITIARKLGLSAPLAGLICDQWLNSKVEFSALTTSIEEHDFDFARVVFDHLKSQGKASVITTKLRNEFPDYVYRYFDNDPSVQWSLAELSGQRDTATEILAKASKKETLDDHQRVAMASLLRIQATITRDYRNIDEASRTLAELAANAQARAALRTPSSPGFAAVVAADTTDTALRLALLPPCAANYVAAINLLGWQGSDAFKRVLAQQIVVNTDWMCLNEASLIYQVLWSPSIENDSVQLLKPFLLGDLQVRTEDVNELVPQRLRPKMAADIAAANNTIFKLPEVKTWIRGACDRV